MIAEQVKALYNDYLSVFKQASTSLASVELLKKILTISGNLQQLAKVSPDAMFGQLLLPKQQLPEVVNFSIQACIMLELLRVRNHINETCGQHMNAALLSLLVSNKAIWKQFLTSPSSPARLTFPRAWQIALHKTQMDVWAQASSLAETSRTSKTPEELERRLRGFVQQLMWLAVTLTRSMSTTHAPRPLSFADSIRRVLVVANSDQAKWIRPLLNYPGLTPPGSIVRNRIGEKALITHIGDSSVQASALQEKSDVTKTLPKNTIVKVAPCQPIKSFRILDSWWQQDTEVTGTHSPYPKLYRLDKPPEALLDVQSHLKKADVDIEELADMVGKEPMLSEHLLSTASMSNRFRLPVSGVKHALMTHGYERANSMLIQHALLQRLSQNDFPLRKSFYQFALLWSHLSGQIALLTKGVMEQEASTLSCFASGGLFTAQSLKTHCSWRVQYFNLYDIRTLVPDSSGRAVLDNSIALAEAWQQGSANITALRNQVQLPERMSKKSHVRKLACVSGLGLILARQLFFGDKSACRDTELYLKQGCQILGVSQQQLSQVQSMAFTYCPTLVPIDYH